MITTLFKPLRTGTNFNIHGMNQSNIIPSISTNLHIFPSSGEVLIPLNTICYTLGSDPLYGRDQFIIPKPNVQNTSRNTHNRFVLNEKINRAKSEVRIVKAKLRLGRGACREKGILGVQLPAIFSDYRKWRGCSALCFAKHLEGFVPTLWFPHFKTKIYGALREIQPR